MERLISPLTGKRAAQGWLIQSFLAVSFVQDQRARRVVLLELAFKRFRPDVLITLSEPLPFMFLDFFAVNFLEAVGNPSEQFQW